MVIYSTCLSEDNSSLKRKTNLTVITFAYVLIYRQILMPEVSIIRLTVAGAATKETSINIGSKRFPAWLPG